MSSPWPGRVSVTRGARSKVVAIDIGGTSIKSVVADVTGDRVEFSQDRVVVTPHHANTVQALEGSVGQILEAVLADYAEGPVGVGISTTGLVSQEGIVVDGPAFKGYTDYSWAAVLKSTLSGSVTVMNDAHAAALGMTSRGSSHAGLTVCLVLGTGIGGAVVLGGSVLTGRNGMSGHFGHMKSANSLAQFRCICGTTGCFENLGSGRGLAFLAGNNNGPEGVDETVRQLSSDLSSAEAARASGEMFESAGHQIGSAIADLANALDPDEVLLAGGLLEAAGSGEDSPLMVGLRRGIKENCIPAIESNLLISFSDVQYPNLTGAALAALAAR